MPAEFLQNKFGGVNQRLLRTESENFSHFDGCWPEWAGVQCRIPGKAILQNYSGQVTNIYQAWNPIGYGIGIIQTPTAVYTSPWSTPSFSINFTPLSNVPINLFGGLAGFYGGTPGYNSGNGLGGGTGTSYKPKWTITDYPITTAYTSNLSSFTGTLSNTAYNPSVSSFPYIPLQPISATTPTTSALPIIASLAMATTNEIILNGTPPPNYYLRSTISSTASNTTCTLNLSSIINAQTIEATFLVTLNGVDTEIPIPLTQTFEEFSQNPVLSINADSYLIPADIIQVAQNFDVNGDPFTVPPSTGAGAYGMAERNQSQNTGITFNFIRVYTCQLTATPA